MDMNIMEDQDTQRCIKRGDADKLKQMLREHKEDCTQWRSPKRSSMNRRETRR